MIGYIFLVAAALIVLRGILGRTFADRVIAVSSLVNVIVLFMVFYSVSSGVPFYVDIALVVVLLSFVGTISIAKYAVKK